MQFEKMGFIATLLTAALLSSAMAQAKDKYKEVKKLDQLKCAADQVAKFDGANWACAKYIDSDTNAETKCKAGEVLLGDGKCASALGLIPPTRQFVERFIDNGDGTITDNETGLMWEKKDAADGEQDLANPHDVNNIYTWSSTLDEDNTDPDGSGFTDFLATLNQKTTDDPESTCFANHCDWRLPLLAELRTILITDACYVSPCIDPIFGSTAASAYWSFTSYTDSPASAWVVDFTSGSVSLGGKTTGGHMRAVRGGR